ncbi:hypothetical protein [Bacillus thuringiensis]|uniref:hypothetical protein n=1 Tax=Bacillus thuringiensis TaxID=1428 RepID=UPI00119F06C9|nr:hypothetical protein [Bacillus thuringiensis]
MATETMSIKDFMDGNYGAKKKWSLFKKKAKKYAPVAVRVGIIVGSAIIFSNIIDIPHVFADGNNPDVNEVFKDVQSNDGKIKNYIDGQLYNRIVNAFEPVIFLIKAVSYPIASVVALCGGLFIMVGSQERGFSLISRAGIGYIVVQMIPLFMRLLVEIAKAI